MPSTSGLMHDDSEKSSGLDFEPSTLAAQNQKGGEVKKGFQLRVVFVQLTLLACILTVVVAPSSTIFINNALHTVDETAYAITKISTKKTTADINNVLNAYKVVAENWGRRPSTTRVMTTNHANLTAEMYPGTWVKEYVDALSQYPFISSLVCQGNEGAAGPVIRRYPDHPNASMVSIDAYAWAQVDPITNQTTVVRGYEYDYLDWSTNLTYYRVYIDKDYQAMQEPVPEATGNGTFTVRYLYGPQSGLNVTFWGYSTNLYGNPNDPRPTHRCQASSVVDRVVYPYLAANLPSNGSVVMFFDTLNQGKMLGSSVKGSITNHAEKTQYPVYDTPNTTVSNIGRFLLRTASQNLTLLPSSATYKTRLDDGRDWYIGIQELLPDYKNRWHVVVAVPRSDYYEDIDAGIKRSIIIISVLSCVGMVCVAGVSVLFTLPLSRLGARMAEVTQMKFSSLQQGQLNRRSFLKEIADLENNFHIMVKAFAAGIKKNADLVGVRVGGNSSKDLHGTVRSPQQAPVLPSPPKGLASFKLGGRFGL
ncbi:hypothetical protein HK104_009638 [Borealophlyctis nickersoniae]|nr:hypothetical protein HK104_009638 [Borealophlyctis nickersoniae]